MTCRDHVRYTTSIDLLVGIMLALIAAFFVLGHVIP